MGTRLNRSRSPFGDEINAPSPPPAEVHSARSRRLPFPQRNQKHECARQLLRVMWLTLMRLRRHVALSSGERLEAPVSLCPRTSCPGVWEPVATQPDRVLWRPHARPAWRLALRHLIRASALCGGPMLLATNGVLAADPPTAPDDASLTLHGVTLYGLIDIGLQYNTHAAPVSDYYVSSTGAVIQKNSNKALFALVSNNMAVSRVGLKGDEHLAGGLSGVFEVTTLFVPHSGELLNCLKSLTLNNGKPLTEQTTGIDCPLAGQLFGRAAYAGLSSLRFGTLTLGRQRTPMGDGFVQYDPAPSLAFSVIGFSGVPGGGGDGEDLFLDSALKYVAKYGPINVAGLYQFGGSGTSANSAVQAQIGTEFATGSVDAFYGHKNNAILAASLSPAQVAALPSLGYSVSNSLAGTVSDNTAYAIAGRYSFGAPQIFGGYEHIEYANPVHPLARGYADIGGYILAFVNNTAYAQHRILQIFWSGLRYSVTPRVDVAAAYYGYRQNSYGIALNAGCTSNQSPSCNGALNGLSLSVDWRFTKRFDAYGGTLWTSVRDGLSSGYLNTSNIATTVGIRYSF
jgi:predicted porin